MRRGGTLRYTRSLNVTLDSRPVGELFLVEGEGLYFAYEKSWLTAGFSLSPFTLTFNEKPQLARDMLFRGLHGPFADSLPDGWGLLLMDRFFDGHFGRGSSRTITQLDRLAYLGNRGMGAFEYRPATEKGLENDVLNLAELFEAAIELQSGETEYVINTLRIAGGSPGGARPKAVVALSKDASHAISAFGPIPEGYTQWIVKFRASDESPETGSIEQAYALMAKNAGIDVPDTKLLDVEMPTARKTERIFATRRFDREGNVKRHMMTVCGLVYADYRMPSMEYSQLLKLTNVITRDAQEVEKMARLMIFNALAHNYDDHTKNFAFLFDPSESGTAGKWTLSPAYDLTFSEGIGEHTTSFLGKGKATRKLIHQICRDFKYLKPDDYIEQTLDSLADWKKIFQQLDINTSAGRTIFNVLDNDWKAFERG